MGCEIDLLAKNSFYNLLNIPQMGMAHPMLAL